MFFACRLVSSCHCAQQPDNRTIVVISAFENNTLPLFPYDASVVSSKLKNLVILFSSEELCAYLFSIMVIKVNVERMSRPIDSINNNKKSIARLGLDIRGAVTYFCFSAEKKLLSGLIIGGAYIATIQ